MPFTIARQEIAFRFTEAQTFLAAIKLEDSGSTGTPSSPHNTNKGLFLVLLYGAIEFSITRIVLQAVDIINSKCVKCAHLSEPLRCLALDPEFNAVRDAGRDRIWEKRLSFFDDQTTEKASVLHTTRLQEDMQNVHCSTISDIFKIFGISDSPIYNPRARQYIEDVVGRRNEVAHGRGSAADVGRAYTPQALENLLSQAQNQITYTVTCFEAYVTYTQYIKASFRARY